MSDAGKSTICCKTFALYRPNPPSDYIEKGAAVEAELPQLYGCVFPDGTTVIRWMTLAGSVAIFPTFEDFDRIHGHPEYGTEIEWQDASQDDGCEWPCANCEGLHDQIDGMGRELRDAEAELRSR
jgi:hypothetical protein